jgi:hypothetical protein
MCSSVVLNDTLAYCNLQAWTWTAERLLTSQEGPRSTALGNYCHCRSGHAKTADGTKLASTEVAREIVENLSGERIQSETGELVRTTS